MKKIKLIYHVYSIIFKTNGIFCVFNGVFYRQNSICSSFLGGKGD